MCYIDNGDKGDVETCTEMGSWKFYEFALKPEALVVAIDYSMKCKVHNRNWRLWDSSDAITTVITFESSAHLKILNS